MPAAIPESVRIPHSRQAIDNTVVFIGEVQPTRRNCLDAAGLRPGGERRWAELGQEPEKTGPIMLSCGRRAL